MQFILVCNMSTLSCNLITLTLERSTQSSNPILAPGEYTFSGTGRAGRVYIQGLICYVTLLGLY